MRRLVLDRNMPKYILRDMNTKTTILIKADKKVKAAAQKAAKEIGIPLGTVLGMYLRKFARERRFEFEAHRMSAKLEKELAEVERDMQRGKNISPAFSSPDAGIAYLHSLKK